MTQNKFQAEPVSQRGINDTGEYSGSDNPCLSILCHVYFNASLNEENVRHLDKIAPQNSLAFLIKGRCFLHPANYNLFPIENIESAVHNCGGAICSNRFQQKSPGGEINYKLLFSVINPDENDKIIMGWMLPSVDSANGLIEMDFARSITEMKNNYSVFKNELGHLQDELASETPTIMVDRRNGSIVAANFSAMTNFKETESNLLNKNFSDIIKNSNSRYNLTITNRQSHKEIPAIIKINPATRSQEDHSRSNDITGPIEKILAATDHLEEQLQNSFDNRFDLETIKSETGSLNEMVSNLKQEIK